MIVYSKKKADFTRDICTNNIEDVILNAFKRSGRSIGKSEVKSWGSLYYMHRVLMLAETPDDAGVTIEYKIPLSSKRIDLYFQVQTKKIRKQL